MNDTKGSTVLVVGATGTVGREVVAALREERANVRALSRSPERARSLGPVEVICGDLRDPAAVLRAVEGVNAAVYVSPHEPDEEQIAEAFMRACEAAGTRLVFIGVHIDGASRVSRAIKRFAYGRLAPHYAPKFRISEQVRMSSADPVVLMPSNFFQNDELFRDDLLAGEFTQLFDKKLNRVDVRDVGVAAARAALDRSLRSGAYPVIGPESLSGADCARVWSEVLGRDVRYLGDEAKFEASLARALEGKKHEDFSKSYRVLRSFELPTDPAQLAVTTKLLGRPPTPYRAYVADAFARFGARRSHAA